MQKKHKERRHKNMKIWMFSLTMKLFPACLVMWTWHQWTCSGHTCDLAREPAQDLWDGSWACWGFDTCCWATSWPGSCFSFNSEAWAEPAQLSSDGELSWLGCLVQFWAMIWSGSSEFAWWAQLAHALLSILWEKWLISHFPARWVISPTIRQYLKNITARANPKTATENP